MTLPFSVTERGGASVKKLLALILSVLLSLAGCALCGLSVGIMWPGSFSTAASSLRTGGTAMFALLALAGDVGCGGGPTLVGMVSDALDGDLKKGILAAIVFPAVMAVCLFGRKKRT